MKTVVLLLLAALSLVISGSNQVFGGSARWNLSPGSGDWNTAANWTPATVPNGPVDIATLDASNTTSISVAAAVEVNEILFDPGASAYNITCAGAGAPMIVSGTGIVNNSSVSQTFLAGGQTGSLGAISFIDNATVNGSVIFFIRGGLPMGTSLVSFSGTSNAGSGSFDSSQYVNQPSFAHNALGGETIFSGTATAGNADILNLGATVTGARSGMTAFTENSNGGNAGIENLGAEVRGGAGGETDFKDSASAGNAGISATAGTGQGGLIKFFNDSSGSTVRVYLDHNGTLDISPHNVPGLSIGAVNAFVIQKGGVIYLGSNKLTLGSADLPTTFSGVIQDGGSAGGAGGSLEKVGSGTVTLQASSLYTGPTTVSGGTLVVNNTTGSATGAGPVQIMAGTLGGSGIISGPVTLGSGNGVGAFLAPATGTTKHLTLTVQNALTFQADSTYTYTFRAKPIGSQSDEAIANGVSINGGATFSFAGTVQGTLHNGTVLTAISNTSTAPISGVFGNMPDGAVLTVNGNNFEASYEGGDGNDLTLTVVP